MEEWVRLQLLRALHTSKAIFRVADETTDEVLRVAPQLLVRWEVKVALPFDDFAVCVMRFLGAKRRPANQTFEHNGTDAPPVAAKIVAFAAENLWSDVVGCADGGIGELAAGLTPGLDLIAVGDCELDLVDRDRLAVLRNRLRTTLGHQLLVV